MANKVRFLSSTDDVLKDATISASSETSGLPVTNVQDDLIRKVYRTTGRDNEWIKFAASGGATGINVVQISNFSASKDAIILWQGNATSDFSSPSLNVTLSMATDGAGQEIRKITHFFDSVETYEHWRLYVEDTGNSSVNIDVGRIMAGRYIEPQQNLREGFSMVRIDPSRYVAVKGRQGYANTRRRYTQLSYSVSYMSESQQDQILAIFEKVGKYAPLMLSLDPEVRPNHNTYYCQIQNDSLSFIHTFGREMNLNDIVFEEKN